MLSAEEGSATEDGLRLLAALSSTEEPAERQPDPRTPIHGC
ncbi:hypothetical protein ACIBMZ_26330 [Micromonospora sp. NPDC049900]